MGKCSEAASCPLGRLVWGFVPLSVKGGGMAIIAVTLLVVAILGRLGKIYIPPAGQWALFTGATMATVCALMCLRFHCQHTKDSNKIR